MMYKCEKCGHEGFVPSEIEVIEGLADILGPDLVAKLGPKFTEVKGEGFRTVFLSVVQRESLASMLLGTHRSNSDVFREKVAPVIKTIDANFKILGVLSPPSVLKMAITDLTQPRALFTFITIEDGPDVEQKLKDLGLGRLILEGHVDTIEPGKDWFAGD